MNTFAERSDLILTVSDTTADDIKKILPESTHKVKVVYPGINHLNDNQENISSEHSPFILSVNTIEKRKNVPFIIKVFNCLKEKYRVKHKLILVGQKSSDYKNVLKEYNKSKFIKDIIIKEYIAEAELVNLYKTADCFLSASEYEGFGFTPLEALRFSCPVFLLKNNVTGELLPSYPYIINKSEPEHWAEFIYTEMMNDYKNFSIPLSLKKFDWESAANRIAFEYEKLLKQNENVFA
jgi:glycosyltransferase involved in cell wall biosynthesis